ncbi:hypothetical protein [Streptomyces sp. UG1]|uniref:hypothetical protein n=1 Tax=Streptomyces sp. UG1 TaxID=3417652 RepID=UPI003CF282FC
MIRTGRNGQDTDPERGRSEAPAPIIDEHERARFLTAMRRRMWDFVDARLVIGGRQALGILDGPLLPPWSDASAPDPGLTAALERLRAIATAPHWTGLNNGLASEENPTPTTSRHP